MSYATQNHHKEELAEIFALTPIPKTHRKHWLAIAMVQAGICVCVPAFLLGGILAESMPTDQAIISGSLGYLIVVVAMSIIGIIGTDLGRASCSVAEASFGKKGSRYIVSALFAINLIGWFAIQNALCGEAFSNFLSSTMGISFPVWASSIVWGLIMLFTAVFGITMLEKLNWVAIPLLLIIMGVGTLLAVRQFGMTHFDSEVDQTMTFLAGVNLSFNFYAAGVVTCADITRFQRTRKDTIKATVWGILPMGIVTLIIGVLLTKIANDFDISNVLITVGLPTIGVIALILSTWTTNSTNAYSAGLDTVMTFNLSDNRRREATIAIGLIGTAIGVTGVLDNLETLLSYLSYVVCPIGGAMMADYWFIRKGNPDSWRSVKGFNLLGVISWAVTIPLAYALQLEYSGIVIAAVIYWLLYQLTPLKAQLQFNQSEGA